MSNMIKVTFALFLVAGTFAIQHQATAQSPVIQSDRHPDCDDDHRHPCPSPKPGQQ